MLTLKISILILIAIVAISYVNIEHRVTRQRMDLIRTDFAKYQKLAPKWKMLLMFWEKDIEKFIKK